MDDIRRKLTLIDNQLVFGRDFHKQLIISGPPVFIAAGLIAGILAQETFNAPVWFWGTVLTIFAAIIVLMLLRAKLEIEGWKFAYPVLACAVCLGAVRLTNYHTSRVDDICNFVVDEQKLATIRGVIVTRPFVNDNNDWVFAKFKYTDPVSSFYLEANEVKITDGWAKVSGTVRVQVNGPVPDIREGDYVQIDCWLDRFRKPSNLGQFDTAEYLARKNVFVAANVESREGIELLKDGEAGSIFLRVQRKLRDTATAALLDPYLEGQNRGLLRALVLGYKAEIDSETLRAFRQTGLLHFVCLSGMNFGIVIGIIWWLCKAAGLMKRANAAVCMIAAVIFLLVVPPNSPALRAGIICFVFCASFFFRRRPNPLNSLSLAAIILLLIKPTDLFETSWQLSFAATFGIIALTDRISFYLYEKITGRFHPPKTNLFTRIIAKAASFVLNAFSISFAAWLASTGILLHQFYTINWLTSVWTVIVSPLIAVISVIGYLKMVVALFLPGVADMAGIIVNGLSNLLIWMVKYFAHWNISEILTGKVPVAVIILYYALIFFVFFARFRRPLIKKIICVAAAFAIISFFVAVWYQKSHRDKLVVTVLNVGHGQAIVAELPGKTNILFDAGSLHISNIGGRIVVPFLNYKGINRLDAIVISHSDIDHINGIPEIVENCEVASVYANDSFLEKIREQGAEKLLNDWLNKREIKVRSLAGDLNVESAAKIKILWPDKRTDEYERLGDNDKSTVSLIEFAGVGILLTSDIEKIAQEKLIELYPSIRPQIVIAPHHGSARTLSADFLEKLGEEILIYSCGEKQYEKQQMTKRKQNAIEYYTAGDGAVTIYVGGNGVVRADTFLK
jgi:competence protein ComEC